MSIERQHAIRTGLGAVLVATGACTLSLNFDDRPCNENADCQYSDAMGVCVDGFCQVGGSDGATAADGVEDGTGATGDGTDGGDDPTGDGTGSGSDGTGDESTEGCTQNSDCSEDQRCGDAGTCLSLLSPECQIVQWPEGQRDNVVFVGSILPTGGLFEHFVQPFENAVQLAVEDFNAQATLQGDRKIAWVACDSTTGPDTAVAAAQHLIDTVGVPAIVGPLFSEEVLAVAEQATIPSGTLLMATGAGSLPVTNLDDNDLVWRTLADDVYQANAIADNLVEELDNGDLHKALILAQETAHGDGMLAQVLSRIDGELSSDQYVALTYADPVDFGTQAAMLAAYGQTIAAAFGELPDDYVNPEDHYTHVVVLGTSEVQAMFYAYMNTWVGTQSQNPEAINPPMPMFYYSAGGAAAMEPSVNEIGSISATQSLVPYKGEILEHLQGMSPIVFDEENFNAFNIRYKIRFGEQDALTVTSLAYDAMMAVMLTLCTVPADVEPTGAMLAAAVPRLNDPQGLFVSFSGTNLDFVEQARNALVVQDGSVDLRGVSGELNWDDKGGVRADVQHWHLINVGPEPPEARLTELRIYRLNSPPATDGDWDPMPPD